MLAVAVLVATVVDLLAMGRTSGFAAIPQWWDASFHANAIRFIADSGNSSPAALNAINATASSNLFYPNAHHVLDATVQQIGGWSVPQVMDVSNGFQAGLFGLSIAVVVAEVTKRRRWRRRRAFWPAHSRDSPMAPSPGAWQAVKRFTTGSRSLGLPEIWLAGLCVVGVVGLFLLKSTRPLLWWLAGAHPVFGHALILPGDAVPAGSACSCSTASPGWTPITRSRRRCAT
jgi:hypothetical protein